MNDQILSELLYRLCETSSAHDWEVARFMAYIDGLSDAGVLPECHRVWLLDHMCNWSKGYDFQAFRAEFSAVPTLPAVEALPVARVGESETSELQAGPELSPRVSGVNLELSDVATPARLPVFGLLGEQSTAQRASDSVSRLPSAWTSKTGKWPLACGASIEVFSTRPGQASAKVLECDSRRGPACAVCPDSAAIRSSGVMV